jgi:hypothetical protein
MAAGYGETQSWPYAYDQFDNGEAISVSARATYARLGRAAAYFTDPFGAEMREWLAQNSDPSTEEELETWRHAAEERLRKLQEANVLLGEQQAELDRLRNELAGERQRADWLAGQSAMFEAAAAERLALLETAEQRLRKLEEANIRLGEQQAELDRLRNELAAERLTLLEKTELTR